jgi:parallel beta-helix repeat protein
MKRFVLMLIFVLLSILTQRAWAADYYVSKSGSDSNPGTEAQPWKTIQKAANTLAAGDTVYIKAGTYKERVIPKNSGSSGKYITFTAYPGDTVSIDGSGITLPAYWGGLLDISNKSYIKISGLRIMNAGPYDNNPGILVDHCSDITIENNYTYNTTSSGIGVWDCSNIIIDNNEVEKACNDGEQECITVAITNNFEIKNNHVHHNGPGTMGGEGIDAKDGSRNGKIYNNHLHHLNRLGIYVDAWDKHTENIEVFRNIVHDIYDNDGFTLASESGGLLENICIYNNIAYNCDICGLTISRNGESPTHPMKNIKIINNTFYNNGDGGWGGGIAVDNPYIQNVVIRNNIVSRNMTFQMEVEPDVSMSNLTVDHNLIHGYRGYDDEIKGTDYVEGNPLFVNASSADFHLTEHSPAIDNGSPIDAPSDDYDGNTRPQGSGYDMGAYEYQTGGSTDAEISLSRTEINITTTAGTTGTITETFTISNSGSGTLDWSVNDNAPWLSVNPTSGSDSGQVIVTVAPTGLSAGSYTGIVTVSSPDAFNSPQTVTVHLTVKSPSEDQAPFGQFETPVEGSTVRSSVPVTGWVLDDVSVESVKIYRGPVPGEGGSRVYIGDALLVEGARPDIETAFPGYPNNSRAGWGYMMLTHFLPNSGNGTFTFYAVVKDSGGHEVTLGSKTITCDNINAVKPFGAIDTPIQGGIAAGSSFRNHGWVLTPMPNKIAEDGSTIHVYVDGVALGHPVYNVYRSDIAALFPGYANSHGAHAYFDFDTTAYTNGVHTIYWTAQDSAGNIDGIGSRYFTIKNYAKSRAPSAERPWQDTHKVYHSLLSDQRPESSEMPVGVIKGYKRNITPLKSCPDKNGKE